MSQLRAQFTQQRRVSVTPRPYRPASEVPPPPPTRRRSSLDGVVVTPRLALCALRGLVVFR